MSRVGASPRCSARANAPPWPEEILTQVPAQGVPDDVYERVRTQLSENELSDLTFQVMSINAWNRVNVGFRVVRGTYDKAFGVDKSALA